MTSAQIVVKSVINNSSFENYPHLDDHTIQTTDHDTPGFKPFSIYFRELKNRDFATFVPNLPVSWDALRLSLFCLNLAYWTYSSRPQMAGMNFVLMTTFPNKELMDDSQKLSEAKLLNAVIVQRLKWVKTWLLMMDEEVWYWIKMHSTRTWLKTRESDFEFSLLIGCKDWSRTPGLHLMGFMALVTFYCPSAISENNYKWTSMRSASRKVSLNE